MMARRRRRKKFTAGNVGKKTGKFSSQPKKSAATGKNVNRFTSPHKTKEEEDKKKLKTLEEMEKEALKQLEKHAKKIYALVIENPIGAFFLGIILEHEFWNEARVRSWMLRHIPEDRMCRTAALKAIQLDIEPIWKYTMVIWAGCFLMIALAKEVWPSLFLGS